MGCFDTIIIPCPRCGEEYDAQSKSGECVLEDYALSDAPDDVMADANRHAPFVCVKCHTVFNVDIKNRQTKQLPMTEEEARKQMWDRLESGDPSKGRNEVEAMVIATLVSEKSPDAAQLPIRELNRLRACEAELRMIRETAQAWLSYKGIEHKNSDDLYANYVINAVLRGEKPGK